MAYGIKDAADIYLKSKEDGGVVYIPYLNSFKLDLKSGGAVFAKKKGVNAIKWSKAMEGCTFEGSLNVINDEILAAMLGAELLTTTSEIFEKEKLTVNTGKIILKSSASIKEDSLFVYKTKADQVGKESVFIQTSGSAPATGEYKYDSSKKEIAFFASDVKDGDIIIVSYLLDVPNLKKAVVKSNANMPYYDLYANVECKDETTGAVDLKQLHLPNVSFSRDFLMELSTENPSAFTLKGDILADINDIMFEFIDLV